MSNRSANRRWSHVLFWGVLAAVIFGPMVEGVFPIFPAVVILGVLLLLVGYAFSGKGVSSRKKGVAVAILSVCFTMTVFDLSVRLVRWCENRNQNSPRLETCPSMPWLTRYSKNRKWEGEISGDLAGMAGKKEWEERRFIRIVTDGFGFPNEWMDAGGSPACFDLVMLGDSFGVGSNTSQECTWSALLARDCQLKVYNLSIGGTGPWQELTNLALESDRLRLREGAIVLWAIFPANDLDDEYHPVYNKNQLPWRGRFGQWLHQFKSFRHRSPLRRTTLKPTQSQVVAKDFLNGRKLLFLDMYARNRKRSRQEILQHPSYPSLKATFDAMVKLAQARGLRLTVVAAPSKEEVYSWVLDAASPWSSGAEPSGFSQELNDLCRQSGVPFLDLKPGFVAESRRLYEGSGELLWWYDDTHWNNRGHQLAAALVHDELLTKVMRSRDGSHH